MATDKLFQFGRRWREIGSLLWPDSTAEQQQAMALLEDNMRDLEDYLPGANASPASGAVVGGTTGNISTTVAAFDFGEWPALTVACDIGDTFLLTGQGLIQTPGGVHKFDLTMSATGATLDTFGSPHQEGSGLIQQSPCVTGIATATDTSVTFNLVVVTYDYNAKFIVGNIYGSQFGA